MRRDIAILCVMVGLASLVTGAVLYQAFNYTDTPSVEAIQEVPVTKGVAPAEYGRQLSGTVNLITHSGANAWHGSASENFRTDCLNARCQFFGTKPRETFNQFGGLLGEPIRRDRIFVLGAFEGYREHSSGLVSRNVPTAKLRGQIQAAVPAGPIRFLKSGTRGGLNL